VQLTAIKPIWALPLAEVEAALQTTPQGLSSGEAQRRLERYGANRLPAQRHRPLLLRFSDQLVHFMALLLWVAGSLAFIAGVPQLGWAIWAVILINGVFSFWQEFKAERTLQALAEHLPQQVRVWRDGELKQLTADQLVCGDRLLLEEGDQIPADCRLMEAHQLYVDPWPQPPWPAATAATCCWRAAAWPPAAGKPWCTPPPPKPTTARWRTSAPTPRAPPAPWRCRSSTSCTRSR
jgi:Ca2+-transporting ATPase